MNSKGNLTILNVAFPLLPVGSDSGGGAEQILYLLERGLADAGHHSIVIAAKGSNVSGDLIETPSAISQITDAVRAEAQQTHARIIKQVLACTTIDLIHFHGLDFQAYLPFEKRPMLATLHLPIDLYCLSALNGNVQLNCVSQNQARSIPGVARCPVVENGINIGKYKLGSAKRGYLLWLGRICPEKGAHIALRVAHRIDLPMVIAGPVHPFHDHQVYFSENVLPLLDNKRRYIGPVGIQKKAQLLSEASCLLMPSLIAETSSLAAMEAIASGTPVVAFRSGALPEIVEHGVTGFIVDSEEEMERSVENVATLSPHVCRSRALERFDYRRMVAAYVELYRRVISDFASMQFA